MKQAFPAFLGSIRIILAGHVESSFGLIQLWYNSDVNCLTIYCSIHCLLDPGIDVCHDWFDGSTQMVVKIQDSRYNRVSGNSSVAWCVMHNDDDDGVTHDFSFAPHPSDSRSLLPHHLSSSPLLTHHFQIPRDRFLSVIRQVLINQCLVSIPIIIIVTKIRSLVGYDDSLLLPTFHRMIFEFVIFILIEEVLFYYGHRGLHHPFIYKYFHKKHHEWQSPIAITAIYCHPIEHVVSNIFPAVMGPILVGSHLSTSVMWFTLAISNAVITHSGYHLPLLPSPESHDYHHLKWVKVWHDYDMQLILYLSLIWFMSCCVASWRWWWWCLTWTRFNQNYGVLGILDRLHGTDAMFRKTKSYNRHILLLSLVPIKKLIPDDHDDYDDAKPRWGCVAVMPYD